VQHDAAHELDVEVPHVENALAGLAADGKGLGEEVVERVLQVLFGGLEGGLPFVARDDLALRRIHRLDHRLQALAEFDRLRAQTVVGEGADLGLEGVDLGDDRQHALDVTLVLGAENGCKYFVDHGSFSVHSNNETGSVRRFQQLRDGARGEAAPVRGTSLRRVRRVTSLHAGRGARTRLDSSTRAAAAWRLTRVSLACATASAGRAAGTSATPVRAPKAMARRR
jgi:hypothetical protein